MRSKSLPASAFAWILAVIGTSSAALAASGPPLVRTPAACVDDAREDEFALLFGTPSSPTFRTSDAATRDALRRFFLGGPGTTHPDGEADAFPLYPVQSAGAQAGSTVSTRREPVPGYPGLVHVTMGGTGSGFVEKFLLQVPDAPPAGPRPLVVAFHKYGTSHADVLFNTSLVEEVRARGWYLIAPLGAMQKNFGCLESQVNVRAAIDWTRALLPIDDARIHGIGFSMGGGGCASFAARHQDPAGPRFASVVDHSGTVSLAHAWANESGEIRSVLEERFGGTPAEQPFAYQRCSTIDLDPATGTVGVDTDMGRNLERVHTWLAASDPDLYLPAQTQAFHAHVQTWHPGAVLTLAPGDEHSWATLDETLVCDWLAQQALQPATSGVMLADDGGTWDRFVVVQDASGAFTPFTWSADAGANRLAVGATRNLRRIAVDATSLGLAYAGTLRLELSSADGSPDQVLLTSVPFAPNAVFRNGQPAVVTYNAVAHTLLVLEHGGAGQWVIVF